MNIDEWRSQIKRGTLEFCILLLISRAPRYGYEIISRLESRPIVAAKESTVYPLLRKLKSDGLLSTYLQEESGGPPRKYYSLTELGKENLNAEREAYLQFSRVVNDMLEGRSDD